MNMLQTFDQSVIKGDIHHLEEAEAQYPDNNNSTQDTEGEYADIEEVNNVNQQEESNQKGESKDANKPKDDLEF